MRERELPKIGLSEGDERIFPPRCHSHPGVSRPGRWRHRKLGGQGQQGLSCRSWVEESLLELTVVVDAVPDGGLDRLHHQHGAGGWGLLAWYWGLLLLTPPYTPASATRAGGS